MTTPLDEIRAAYCAAHDSMTCGCSLVDKARAWARNADINCIDDPPPYGPELVRQLCDRVEAAEREVKGMYDVNDADTARIIAANDEAFVQRKRAESAEQRVRELEAQQVSWEACNASACERYRERGADDERAAIVANLRDHGMYLPDCCRKNAELKATAIEAGAHHTEKEKP